MNDGAAATQVRVVGRIAEIDAASWDRCANPEPAIYNPFQAHAFLKALEDAGHAWRSVGLAAAAPGARNCRWHGPGGGAGLSQEPQPGPNTCSTTAGRRPTNAPADAIIPSCRSRCRSRRYRGGGSWRRRVLTRTSTSSYSRRRPSRSPSAPACRHCTRRLFPKPEWTRLGSGGLGSGVASGRRWPRAGGARVGGA